MTENNSLKPWERQPDEPLEWFDRFHIYLSLGPSRNLTAAFRIWSGSQGDLSGTAGQKAKEWRWKERAIAFDQAKREERAAYEEAREAEARQRRRYYYDIILEDSAVAIKTADLKNLTTQEARDRLPSLRHLFVNIAEQQRRDKQSLLDREELHPSAGWPVLDEEAMKILRRYNNDEK